MAEGCPPPWPAAGFVVIISLTTLCFPHGLLRSLSDVQEAAQLLGGKDMPTQVMETLFMGTPITKEWSVAILNLSPFEGTYEMAMLEHRLNNSAMPKLQMMSVSENVDIVRYTERALAWHLLEVRNVIVGVLP